MKNKESITKLNHQPLDETKPGLGQYYCINCAKYFDSVSAKNTHMKGRFHKRRVKELKEGPYTQEEANFAAGHNVKLYLQKKEERELHQKAEHVVQEVESGDKKKDEDKEMED